MKKLLGTMTAASAGSTAGYVVFQLLEAKKNPIEGGKRAPMVVAAGPATTTIAVLVAMMFRSKSRIVALVLGFVLAVALGDKIEMMIPGLANVKQSLHDRAGTHSAP